MCAINIYITHTLHTHATQTYQYYPKTCRNDRNQLNFTPKYKCINYYVKCESIKHEAAETLNCRSNLVLWNQCGLALTAASLPRILKRGAALALKCGTWPADILGSRNCNWCPSLATLWWVAGLTGRSWDSLVCSGTNWCVLVLTGVFWDSLWCPETPWCVLELSGMFWTPWCVLGLSGVFWDSLVCPGTHWCVLGLPSVS